MAEIAAPSPVESLTGGTNGTVSAANSPSAPTAPSRPRALGDYLADLRERLPEGVRDPSRWADDAEVFIRKHPLKTVAGVFVGGLVLGYALRGRR